MKGDLRKAYSNNNIELAYKRLLRNSDRHYKAYFRNLYRSYTLAGDQALYDLGKRLRANVYPRQSASKTFTPKPSMIQRPMTLLAIEDQITYQCFANIVADYMYPVVRKNYGVKTFSNMYSGPTKEFFYRDWRTGYRAFTDAFANSYHEGYCWIASFDLTACYDSIDHSVLRYFLTDLGIDDEFCDELIGRLSRWSALPGDNPIFQGHGIPQGPLSSGIFAESVLRAFDDCNVANSPSLYRYLRYVDDIKLLSKTEEDLRRGLLELDRCSKRIGLFPQSSKINIHKIENVQEEIKTISLPDIPPPFADSTKTAEQAIALLTKNLIIKPSDESAFKYWLPNLKFNATNAIRLIKLLQRYPHLASSIASWFLGSKKLSRKVSHEMIVVLAEQAIYSGSLAEFVNLLEDHVHPSCAQEFIDFCTRLYSDDFVMADPVLRASVKKVLVSCRDVSWREKKKMLYGEKDWWVTSQLVFGINPNTSISKERLTTYLNKLICSNQCDIGVSAAERLGSLELPLMKKSTEIRPRSTQLSLKNQALIGVVRKNADPVGDSFMDVCLGKWDDINWRPVLGDNYRVLLHKVGRWRSYALSDPTAWLNYTDTFDDLILESLSKTDPHLKKYTQGYIGRLFKQVNDSKKGQGNVPQVAYFANSCPAFYSFAEDVHNRRCDTDLAHPKNSKTKKPTGYVTYSEKDKFMRRLPAAYNDVWNYYQQICPK